MRILCGLVAAAVMVCPMSYGQVAPDPVDAIFESFATAQSGGCAVGVTRDDALLTTRAYGIADLEHGVALTPQSVFYVASVAKQFTALSVLLLERDGKVHLDDRVRTYVPELPDYANEVTIRQLLHHTSGLRDYLDLFSLAGNPFDYVITERAMLNMLARQKRLNFAPGTEHLYSNSGYVLLSIIVNRVAGRPIDEFAREKIFTPLGMHSTRFQHDHATPIPGRATGYVRQNEKWRISNVLLDVVGDGGMYSTVGDMMRWATAFERPEFAALLSRMLIPGTLSGGRPIQNGYGMGLSRGSYRGRETVAHGGSFRGFRAHFLRLPTEKLTVVTLCNNGTANATRLAERVADVYMSGGLVTAESAPNSAPPQARSPSPVPREFGKAVAGEFYSDELDAIYRIAVAPDGVTLELGDNAPIVLSMAGPDRLRAFGEFVLVRDATGRVVGFTLNAGSTRAIAFTRQ